ncbi:MULTISPECIES: DUF982 domain-containing protein [Ochrobactrum]|uniref:DUF982 domain-containing protein n=1 Tax=Ochrobactrum quorumnocens TaxID=271865 RepID=A0A5N1JW62_9HYPH|nr:MULTISPECIES: DUF982 domain-containing protein [Brucella/Ochrobactrum group]KAA9368246.1 DUF982 domain-containing protein [[Ochrobactrum] quorumnocens]MBD7991856.1 DUF982 domain-containing protein [Ochrobactrum gallinarum]MDH7792439.1 hypothetical protein [Ochrobactrum sp. AN78]
MSWGHPLKIHFESGPRIIRSSAGAAQCLLTVWPEDALDEDYRLALHACLNDIEGQPNDARSSFVAAAKSAGLLTTTLGQS